MFLYITKVKGWSEQQTDKPLVEGNNSKNLVEGINSHDNETRQIGGLILVNQQALENIQPKCNAVKLRIHGHLADICDTMDYLRKVDQQLKKNNFIKPNLPSSSRGLGHAPERNIGSNPIGGSWLIKNNLIHLPISNHNTRLMIVNFKRHFKEKCESSRSAD